MKIMRNLPKKDIAYIHWKWAILMSWNSIFAQMHDFFISRLRITCFPQCSINGFNSNSTMHMINPNIITNFCLCVCVSFIFIDFCSNWVANAIKLPHILFPGAQNVSNPSQRTLWPWNTRCEIVLFSIRTLTLSLSLSLDTGPT